MPKKPQKWEIKAWVLADAANGYVWNRKLYTGKEDNVPASNLGLADRVVLDLLAPKQGAGTTSTFTAVLTFFEICRRGLRKGESHFSMDDSLLYMKWRDK